MKVPSHYLTTGQLAERYQASESTIRHWRATGYGPPGVQFGRRILYPIDGVEAWERDRLLAEGVA